MNTTIPECLTRTPEKDLTEAAMTKCQLCGHRVAGHDAVGCEHCFCKAQGRALTLRILSRMQRSHAEAVWKALGEGRETPLKRAAGEFANFALTLCEKEHGTLEERADALDLARRTVKKALEVAR